MIATREPAPRGGGEPAKGVVGDDLAADSSVLARLVEAHPACAWDARRDVAAFAAAAIKAEGAWWAHILDSDPAALTGEEARQVELTFSMWVAGQDPFRRGAAA